MRFEEILKGLLDALADRIVDFWDVTIERIARSPGGWTDDFIIGEYICFGRESD